MYRPECTGLVTKRLTITARDMLHHCVANDAENVIGNIMAAPTWSSFNQFVRWPLVFSVVLYVSRAGIASLANRACEAPAYNCEKVAGDNAQ